VRQVGYLQELNRDALSTKYKEGTNTLNQAVVPATEREYFLIRYKWD
jgi:hypothetical protein